MRAILWALAAMLALPVKAQLKAGFDANEYKDLLNLHFDGDTSKSVNHPPAYRLLYTSPEVGFYNKWMMWERADGIDVIQVRGTIGKLESWLANFYAAMIPAKGTLRLNDSTTWDYQLAADTMKAYVHVGWTAAVGFMSADIISHIKERYARGTRQFIVTGHSQGGAIAFLLRSYLEYHPGLPKDIIYKTYASAAPKPGNLFYAYDFENITRDGWGFRVVNSDDWVPETPLSLQTVEDYNMPNPFMNVKGELKKQKFFVRLYGNLIYNRLTRTTNRSVRRFRKTLGNGVFKLAKRHLPEMQQPNYVFSNNYMTCGTPIVLMTDAEYHKKFPFNGKNIFVHHMMEPYLWLLNKHYSVSD
ncbi:lipase family protein [Chitinophaga sp. NPDC101104]|uniref:lipase family protein n=1 Tax=Chitinophaga sp. NPDC101104 TaxID=3390561 RepID=UPI003D026155